MTITCFCGGAKSNPRVTRDSNNITIYCIRCDECKARYCISAECHDRSLYDSNLRDEIKSKYYGLYKEQVSQLAQNQQIPRLC